MKKYNKKDWFSNVYDFFASRIHSSILCIKYPFLYPRNRFDDLHYSSYKMDKKLQKTKEKIAEIQKEELNAKECKKLSIKFKFRKFLIYNWYKVLKFHYYYTLQIIHGIPDYTELDAMEPGWRKVFGEHMCKEIKAALLEEGGKEALKKYRILQIKEKFGCYDEETEVLTESGWKFFKDVTYNDKIATLNHNTKELVYQMPSDIINEPYIGPMYHLVNRGLDIKVTPNHKLYVSKGSYYNGSKNNEKHMYPMELVYPGKYFRKNKRFEKTCIWNGIQPSNIFKIPDYSYTNIMDKKGHLRTYKIPGPNIDIHAFLRFLGFYIAEGSTYCKKYQATISVAYNPKTEHELAASLITDMGFNLHKRAKKGVHSFNNMPLGHWLQEHCGHLAPNKKVPDFIKQLPTEYIEEFLYYLYLGDGYFGKTCCTYSTVSKQLADDICELLLKCNSCFNLTKRPAGTVNHTINGHIIKPNYDSYNINWLKLPDIEVRMSKEKNVKSYIEQYELYKGNVYCVTVPNHIIYVRRNGKGVWCGNCLRWYDSGDNEKIREIIKSYEWISYYTCGSCGRDAKYHTRPWIYPLCENCISNEAKKKATLITNNGSDYNY